MKPSRPRDFAHLAYLLEESAEAIADYSASQWMLDRMKLCRMWAYVLRTAPDDIRRTAAWHAAHYFHPKADFQLPDQLKQRVEDLASELASAVPKGSSI